MISAEDLRYYTFIDLLHRQIRNINKYFKILPQIHNWSEDTQRIKDGKRVKANFVYSSENNNEWMTVDSLRSWVNSNHKKIGSI